MENKTQSDLEKRIKRTDRIKNVALGGLGLGGLGTIASFAYFFYFNTHASVLSEYRRLEVAQNYTERINDTNLKYAVEDHYTTRLYHIEQKEEYKREREEGNFYNKICDYSSYLMFASLAVVGMSLVYSDYLKQQKKKIEEESFRSRIAK